MIWVFQPVWDKHNIVVWVFLVDPRNANAMDVYQVEELEKRIIGSKEKALSEVQ